MGPPTQFPLTCTPTQELPIKKPHRGSFAIANYAPAGLRINKKILRKIKNLEEFKPVMRYFQVFTFKFVI